MLAGGATADPAPPPPDDAPVTVAAVASLEASRVQETGISGDHWDQLGPSFALEVGRLRAPEHWIGHLGVSEFRDYPPDLAYTRYVIVDGLAIYEHRWGAFAAGGGVGLALADLQHHDICFGQPSYSRSYTFIALHVQASYDVAKLGAGTLAARVDGDFLPFNVLFFIPDAAADLYIMSVSLGVAYRFD